VIEKTVTMSLTEYESLKAEIAKLKENSVTKFVSANFADVEAAHRNKPTLTLDKKVLESYFNHPIEII
jgi:hypothetical protein